MPELPEVETVRRGLEQHTQGRTLSRVEILRERAIGGSVDGSLFCCALEGSCIAAWHRRGKYLLAPLERDGRPAGTWGVHLRMTGQFLWLQHPQPVCNHTRVRLWCDSGEELRFVDTRSFGQMWWVPPQTPLAEVITGLAQLGPEPFSDEFSAPYLRQKLKSSVRPIKTALLDQRLVAGVGNIYADESLFAAGINPHTPSRQLGHDQLERLRQALITVLRQSIGAGGTTFRDFRDLTGTNGNYGGEAWVYRRAGQACRRCASTIQRAKLGGRSSHWCPSCQSPR
ncbi:MAG: DNA-formamidopyrimidine glycosylase [Cyanobacteriota bacterium]|nr:DNA-formamidopyrimidine glycosylase [Cyanobacteriota bacterium]